MRAAWFLWLSLLPSAIAAAQTVSVRVIDETTRRPIEGAIVGLVDEQGRHLDQTLSNSVGLATLKAVPPVRLRVRGDRIGFAGAWSDWFALGNANPMTITLVLPSTPVVLAELVTTSATSCGGAPEAASLALAIEEMRKNVRSTSLTASIVAGTIRIRRYTRQLTLNGREVGTPVDEAAESRTVPFVAQGTRFLHETGYADSVDGRWRFHAPDSDVLLSDEFLTDHCWRARRSRQSGFVDLEFEPAPDRSVPEIRGAVRLDSATKELSLLEFTYQNLPYQLRGPGLGGKIWFRRLGPGAIVVDHWYVRAPIFFRVERLAERPADSLVGYQEDGGVAAIDRSTVAAVVLGDPAPAVRRSLTTVDVEGRVVTPSGAGVPEAEVLVADSVAARTGEDGRFTLPAVSLGDLQVRVRAIGYVARGVAARIEGPAQAPLQIVLTPVAQVLAPLEVRGVAPARLSARIEEFEHRRKFGIGHFFPRAALDNPMRPTLAELLQQQSGIRLVPIANGGLAAGSSRAERVSGRQVTACLFTIYQDGAEIYRQAGSTDPIKQSPVDLRQLLSQQFEAIEVYVGPAQIPAEYNATGGMCGLILLWSREGH
jgi:hypothetical protein